MRLGLRVALCLCALAGALYLFAYPARTYLGQRAEIRSLQEKISVLDAADAKLSSRETHLKQLSYIERLARAEYGLVMPGQQAFTVLPPSRRPAARAPAAPGAREGLSARQGKAAPWYAPLEFWDHL